jgi:hypothetical protein
MDLQEFKQLDQTAQKAIVWHCGEHIATRDTIFYTIALWQIEGFYVEVVFSQLNNKIEKLNSFYSTELLKPYLDQIDISPLFLK